jgi:hypothetical protein
MGMSHFVVTRKLFEKPPRRKGAGSVEDKWVDRLAADLQTCDDYYHVADGLSPSFLKSTVALTRCDRRDGELSFSALDDRQLSKDSGSTRLTGDVRPDRPTMPN